MLAGNTPEASDIIVPELNAVPPSVEVDDVSVRAAVLDIRPGTTIVVRLVDEPPMTIEYIIAVAELSEAFEIARKPLPFPGDGPTGMIEEYGVPGAPETKIAELEVVPGLPVVGIRAANE